MSRTFINAHIVLDIPDPAAAKVMDLRKRYKDHFRSSLPVEVTLTGSSGIGVMIEEQDQESVFETINEIAARTRPIEASFGQVIRFPNTDIFAFSLDQESNFIDLHKELVASDIQFHPNRFPYKPHCTIRSLSPVSDEEEQEIMSNEITDRFILDALSVYSLGFDDQGDE